MTILWRVFLLIVLHVGVLIAFPDFTEYAPITVFILFLLSCGGMVAITSLISIMGMGRYFIMNRAADIIIVLLSGAILLLFTPQTSGVSPWDRVMKGQYPTQHDIDRGLAKFGIKEVKQVQSGVNSAVGKIGSGLQDAKSVVINEPNR